MQNPFIFGGPVPPDEFYGRRHSIAFIMDRLYGRSRSSIALRGDRRVGKTSLLRYLAQPSLRQQWQVEPGRHHMVFIDCQIFSQFDQKVFWTEVLEQFADTCPQSAVADRAEALLDADEISDRALRRWLRQMQRAGETMTLLLDEFSYLLAPPDDQQGTHALQAFLGFMRVMITDVNPTLNTPRALAIITATRRPLDEVVRPVHGSQDVGSPFYNPFVAERLKPFEVADVHALLAQKLADSGVTFSEAEIDHLLATAGRHPILVQMYAGELFTAKQETEIEVTDFAAIDGRFRERCRQYLHDFWLYSSELEQRFMNDIVQGNLVWDALSASEEMARTQLNDRGLMAGNQLFSPLFHDWLYHNRPELEVLERTGTSWQKSLIMLRMLSEFFNLEELATLSFELHVDFEDLPGSGKTAKAQALVKHMQNRGRLHELMALLQQKRPHLA